MCGDLQKSIAAVVYFRLMMENILLLGHVFDIKYAMHFIEHGVEVILLSSKKSFEFWLAFVFVPFKLMHGLYIYIYIYIIRSNRLQIYVVWIAKKVAAYLPF